jgi:hypothetical protein
VYTKYSYHARRILIDDFSALRHGDAMVVRTFVSCVLDCKSTLYVLHRNNMKKLFRAGPAIRVPKVLEAPPDQKYWSERIAREGPLNWPEPEPEPPERVNLVNVGK